MTIQTLFNRMMLLDNQLDLIAGGDDVTRGLVAVNLVQDWLELAAAEFAKVFQTHQTLLTVASQEYTTWPTGLLRLDALWRLDSNSRQIVRLEPIEDDGGHMPSVPGVLNVATATLSSGAPVEYAWEGQGGQILWNPTPDAAYTMRGYGLWAVADYTAAADTFGYPDSMALALVPEAVKLFRVGLDRDKGAQQEDAMAKFRRLFKVMGKQVRDGAAARHYAYDHDT